MNAVPPLGSMIEFRADDGELVRGQLRALITVGIYNIGRPGFVQYATHAEGIGPMPPTLQAKMLRAAAEQLEERSDD